MAAPSSPQQGSGSHSTSIPPEPIIVTDVPKLDIDLYIQNYTGRTRLDRLLLIGKSCIPLRVEALKAAVIEAKSGSDVARYLEAWDQLQTVAPNEPEARRDERWIEKTDGANKQETIRLESELRGYRNNLIKESIRMGNEDLGRHFEKIGLLAEATDAYSKMRPDASTTKHIMDCGIHLANVALQRRDWSAVLNNMNKVSNVIHSVNEHSIPSYTKLMSGIALMGNKRMSEAAKSFMQIVSNVPSAEYNHIATPTDIAIYGGLLALATMDRTDLQKTILDNANFRVFLEIEHHIRKAIVQFVGGRYASCLEILESVRADYTLDLYLQPHISDIYSKIRAKCIVQYFIPYSCVTLDSLEAIFSAPGVDIESELVNMIRQGDLKARIDTQQRLLLAFRPDPRLTMQTKALNVARKYEQEAKERLRRMNIVAAGLEVSGKLTGHKKNPMNPSGSTDQVWHELQGPAMTSADGDDTRHEL